MVTIFLFLFPDTQPGVPAGPLMAACVLSCWAKKEKRWKLNFSRSMVSRLNQGIPGFCSYFFFFFLFHMLSLLHQESLGAVALVC